MKKMILTMLVLVSILNLSNCSPKKKKGGILDKLIPLALLGGGTGNGSTSANGGSSETGSGNTGTTANGTGGTGSNTGGGGNGTGSSGGSVAPPTNLAYDKSFYSVNINTTKTLTPTLSGTVTKCEANPALPQGMSISQTDCVISGTPTATIYPTNFVITASNAGGNTTANFKLRVINGIPVYLSQWGFAMGQGKALALDSEDNIYLAANNKVKKYNSEGNFITEWTTPGFNSLYAIAIDKSNRVYVGDWDNNQIIKSFTLDGNYLSSWGSFNLPWYISSDSQGNIYVADRFNNKVQKFDSNLNFLIQWGSAGSGEGQFINPLGIAIDELGNVFVATYHRIQKFDSSGNFILQWGSDSNNPGNQDGKFNYPWAMKVDMSGNLFITELNNNRIQIFDLNGNYIAKWGIQGSGNGEFFNPTGIAIDSLGNIYILDQGNNRIQKFAP